MSFFMKLAAYAFLALMGFSAWRAGVEGWRYYFGIVLFIVCTLRILIILRQRMTRGTKSGDTNTPPPQEPDQSPPER
jgi:4-hydroxybenzoate polyprenyltransferase